MLDAAVEELRAALGGAVLRGAEAGVARGGGLAARLFDIVRDGENVIDVVAAFVPRLG